MIKDTVRGINLVDADGKVLEQYFVGDGADRSKTVFFAVVEKGKDVNCSDCNTCAKQDNCNGARVQLLTAGTPKGLRMIGTSVIRAIAEQTKATVLEVGADITTQAMNGDTEEQQMAYLKDMISTLFE